MTYEESSLRWYIKEAKACRDYALVDYESADYWDSMAELYELFAKDIGKED